MTQLPSLIYLKITTPYQLDRILHQKLQIISPAADQYPEYCQLNFDKEADIVAVADMLAYDYRILSMITFEEAIRIALFKVKMMGNVSCHSHKNYSDILRSLLSTPPPSMEIIHHLLQKITGITLYPMTYVETDVIATQNP